MAFPVANTMVGTPKDAAAAQETLDIHLKKGPDTCMGMGFGMVLKRVIDEQRRQFVIVEKVRKDGPAEAGHVLEGDIVVAVNGENIMWMGLPQVKSTIDKCQKIVLTVLTSGTFRLFDRHRERLVQMVASETLKLRNMGSLRGHYGFGTFELRTSNVAGQIIRCHLILKVRNPRVVTPGKGIYPNDVLLAIEGVSVDKMDTAQVKAKMAGCCRSEISITIAPISLLRVSRPPLIA
ncbi:uncharacterized protein LOC135398305 isoform X1 [Ornithodoros turicata]|uniref:uncharacterized protein LOC135398305 isoform X1 n=1 Tax=Ornithodoros turicata TaxID=34597 RepID=UPI003138953F